MPLSRGGGEKKKGRARDFQCLFLPPHLKSQNPALGSVAVPLCLPDAFALSDGSSS